MEDLYSNLENYDDVNAVDELRNENKELKHKLEESSKAMNQLQKNILQDFDKLNSEYKKLEINYSSLLKTARAEIERKTQLITNLNKEKDMIVIKAMQGGRNVLRNVNKPFHNYKKNEANKKIGENKEMLNKNKPGLSGNSREGSRESSLLLMKDNTPVPASYRPTSSEQNLKQLDDSHSKENMSRSAQSQINNSNKPKSAKISNRRKSMPVLSKHEEQVSSEEDIVKENAYTNTRHENISYQKYDNIRQNSQYTATKEAQKFNRSEQFTNEPKQTYNRSMNRYNAYIDRHMYNQNYDNFSPERERHQHRGRDFSHRSDHYRQRVLESPPKDKYNRSKSRERRHRQSDHRRDFDYYNSRYEERYDERSNIREPDRKRPRINSGSTDRERHEQGLERRSYRMPEYILEAGNENHTSCQSPDYDQIESNFGHHFVKEIKNTATVPLEDPRINSKRYMLKGSDQGTFITTVDKNICMIPLDKTVWGVEEVEVPEALKANIWEEPARNDIVNSVYMDIIDPDNISPSKSSTGGKSETLGNLYNENVCGKEYSTSDKVEQKLENAKNKVSESIVSDNEIQERSKVDVKSYNVKEHVNTIDCNHFDRNLSTNDYKRSSNILKDEIRNDNNYQLKTQQPTPFEHNIEGDLELSDEASDITDELQITCKQSDKLTHVLHRDTSGDVGDKVKCSEKTCKTDVVPTIVDGNIDSTPKNIAQKAVHNKEKEEKIQTLNEKADKEDKNIEPCKKKTTKNKDTKIIEKTDENAKKEVKETRKREKRKRLPSKEREKEKKESKTFRINTGENVHDNEHKDSKPYNKFTELFGESSSLITPEDLNMIPTKFDINIERNDNYGSLFENTQDAIDLNVREIKEVSRTDGNLKVLENVEAHTVKKDFPNTIDENSIFEIKSDQSNDNVFKNLKPAVTDNESDIVKTIVISSGVQPCTKEKNTNHTNVKQIDSNEGKETERVVKHQPLELLRAIATSTPNKALHEDQPRTITVVTPDGESLNADSNLSYSTSLTTATNVEANNNAPDVRIFIKRRRKIKKI